MGKAERIRSQAARERIAAQQAAALRAERRRRLLVAGSGVVVVVALVAAIIVAKLVQRPPAPGGTATSAALAAQVTTVPAATFNAVGAGTDSGLQAISGVPELTLNGKPEVLYMGGEFCPFCAAERWAIAAAVSRFGALSGLSFIHSSPADIYANTPTLSFSRASYRSAYLSFVPVEWYGEAGDPNTPLHHVYLQHPTAQEVALFGKYAGGAIPFLDIANRYLLPETSYLPSALAGLTWSQVAADMHDPRSAAGQDIDAAANIITAAICRATGGQPGAVCGSAAVAKAAGSL
jgi:hypothetical protein